MSSESQVVDRESSNASHKSFIDVDYPEPHRAKTKELLQKHPEIKELFGRNPWTAVICVGIVTAQVGLAVALESAPWWAIVLTAYAVGAFLVHGLFAVVHETAHKRVLKGRLGNEIIGWIANLPSLVPSSSSFRNYHLKHHRYQGDPEFDADLASEKEAEWVGDSTVRKVMWQLFYPIIQSVRTMKFQKNGKIPFWTKWVVGNTIVQFTFLAVMFFFVGPWSLVYLGLSLLFSLGLHPLSARLIQEHFVFHDKQETYSYYGVLNALSLNVYHHNEHHDFPAIAWHNLPRLRKIAADYYEGELHYHTSLTKLWLRFLFDPAITLHNRVRRDYSADTDSDSSRGRAMKAAESQRAHRPQAAE